MCLVGFYSNISSNMSSQLNTPQKRFNSKFTQRIRSPDTFWMLHACFMRYAPFVHTCINAGVRDILVEVFIFISTQWKTIDKKWKNNAFLLYDQYGHNLTKEGTGESSFGVYLCKSFIYKYRLYTVYVNNCSHIHRQLVAFQ